VRIRLLSLLAGAALALCAVEPALAQAKGESVKFALCYDLSKTYAAITPQVSQAARDYAKLLNQKGGIEGHPIEILIEDHGNEPQRAIECYEKMKRAGAVAYDFYSTPVARAVLPRLMKDGNVMVQSIVGRGDAVDGDVFKWVFPIAPTYWSQAANVIQYFKTRSNNNLKDKKIAFLYVDTPFGQEPIGVLKTIAAREGFDLQLFPYPLPGNDQAAAWTQIRRFNPDWVVSWSVSMMHAVASREMKRNGIAIDKYMTGGWISEGDMANIGLDAAKGLKRVSYVVPGQDNPLIQRILKELYDKGLGSGDRKNIDSHYNTGLAIFSNFFEGARLGIKKSGWPLSPDNMRLGLESLRDYDANGLMAPLTVTAKDHGGGGKTRIEMWDGAKWVPQTDWYSAYRDVVLDAVKTESSKFSPTNP
jgi:branched-chain amino acid transport system substrate-binding protein